ncbi:MAG: hypothetical protein RLZZ458_1873, partial [Planctomycetota bacterium]
RSPFLEEDFLPVVEIHDADPVLFADLRDRHVLDEVLAKDGDLLLTGIVGTPGHWRYPFSDRQTPAHFSSRASRSPIITEKITGSTTPGLTPCG